MLNKLYQVIESGEYRGADVIRRVAKSAFWMGLTVTFLVITWSYARGRETEPMSMLLLSFMSLTLMLTAMLSFMRTEEDEVEDSLSEPQPERHRGDRFGEPIPQPVLADRRYPRRARAHRQYWN